MSTTHQPTREDKVSFGPWSVGWLAHDPFGCATGTAIDRVQRPLAAR